MNFWETSTPRHYARQRINRDLDEQAAHKEALEHGEPVEPKSFPYAALDQAELLFLYTSAIIKENGVEVCATAEEMKPKEQDFWFRNTPFTSRPKRPWIVYVNEAVFEAADERTREAYIAHALRHIGCVTNSDGKPVKLWKEKHDVLGDFADVLEEYGAYNQAQKVLAALLRQHDPAQLTFQVDGEDDDSLSEDDVEEIVERRVGEKLADTFSTLSEQFREPVGAGE